MTESDGKPEYPSAVADYNIDDEIERVSASFDAAYPDLPPLSAASKAAIKASIEAAPPMSDAQCRKVGRVLRTFGRGEPVD